MAAPSKLNERSPGEPFPRKASPKPAPRMSGDLVVMAALIGISRALFGSKKQAGVGQTLETLREDVNGQDRGRDAETPGEIPAKGWKDIAWRVYEGIQNDRVFLVAAGVTFYALLALFPATAALVSLYGLFADASSINEHLRLASGFLPEGALEVIGDQVKRIASQKGTLGLRSSARWRWRCGAPMPAPRRSSMRSTSSIRSVRSAVSSCSPCSLCSSLSAPSC